jgi:hypothetical protein
LLFVSYLHRPPQVLLSIVPSGHELPKGGVWVSRSGRCRSLEEGFRKTAQNCVLYVLACVFLGRLAFKTDVCQKDLTVAVWPCCAGLIIASSLVMAVMCARHRQQRQRMQLDRSGKAVSDFLDRSGARGSKHMPGGGSASGSSKERADNEDK